MQGPLEAHAETPLLRGEFSEHLHQLLQNEDLVLALVVLEIHGVQLLRDVNFTVG